MGLGGEVHGPGDIWAAARARHAEHHRRERLAARRARKEAKAHETSTSSSHGVQLALQTTGSPSRDVDDEVVGFSSREASEVAAAAAAAGRAERAAPVERPAPRRRFVIDPEAYPEAKNLATLMRDLDVPRGDLVTITFSDSKMAALTVNWALHLRGAGVPHVVGALDRPMLDVLIEMGAPTAAYDLPYGNLDGGSSHASDNWKTFAKMRIGQVRALLEMGYDVLMSDVDVVWRRDPRPFLQCGYDHGRAAGGGDEAEAEEEEGGEDAAGQLAYLEKHGRGDDDCMGISAAEVMVSSDNLSPKADREQGAMYGAGGVFNTGIVFLKHTRGAKKFAEAWNAHLNAREGRYSRLTSDQQVFNAMTRQEGSWPGLQPVQLPPGFPVTRVLTANGLLDGSTFRLGVLPVALFNPGHVYFLQRVRDIMPGVEPYGVHATYTFDGSTGAAKRLRFAEVGLWDHGADDAATAAASRGRGDGRASGGGTTDASEKFLTFDPEPAVDGIENAASIGNHLEGGSRQLAALRDAFAIAAVLNRTLAVPRLRCFCDKVWGGHDNIFNFNCHYPGSADSGHIPGPCPLDHFVNPSRLRDAGVRFVAAAELDIPPWKKAVGGRGTVDVVVTDARTAEDAAAVEGTLGTVGIPAGADEATLVRLLGTGDVSRAALLRLSTARGGTFGGFASSAEARRFNAAVVRALEPPEWCSECHPHGCKNLIPPEVIRKGRLVPVREVHDQFCASFQRPAAVPEG